MAADRSAMTRGATVLSCLVFSAYRKRNVVVLHPPLEWRPQHPVDNHDHPYTVAKQGCCIAKTLNAQLLARVCVGLHDAVIISVPY